ncbi:MAG: hypothetical protein GY928_25635, partial [Colwellia sp.]|nr:hypothetical protein [Colwellia sp.]
MAQNRPEEEEVDAKDNTAELNPRDVRGRFRNAHAGIDQNTEAVAAQGRTVAAQATQLRQILAQLNTIRENTDLNIDSISRDDV